MKMKTQRENAKKPVEYNFKHSCGCLGSDEEYLLELPKTAQCYNPVYWEKVDGRWVDVTHKVEVSDF